MGSPRQTFAGETRLSRQSGGQGQPRDGVPPIIRYIPVFSNSLAPASLPKTEEEKEEDAEKFLGKSSSEKYLFPSGPTPTPPTPSPRSSMCRRLSFKMNRSRNRRNGDLKPSFPF